MLDCQAQEFQLPPELHYLNCAYMAPLARSVEAAGVEAVRSKRDPSVIVPDDFFRTGEVLRTQFSNLVGGDDPSRVALIPSASYGLASAARNLPIRRGQEILMVEEQFPSHVYTWSRLAADHAASVRAVGPTSGPERGKDWNARILDAIGVDTAVVALPHVHWADGTRFDLESIGVRCREVGAALIIDGTQSVGALPFDVEQIRPDAVICAGYKWLLGPYSFGFGWYGPRFDDGVPIEENWIARKDSADFAGLVRYRDEYGPGATRYDVGERSNFALAPMMQAALSLIEQWSVEAIQAYCASIARPIVVAAREYGYAVESDDWRGSHLFGVRVPEGIRTEDARAELSRRNVSVSVRGDAIRVAPHVYNTRADADALIQGLAALVGATV